MSKSGHDAFGANGDVQIKMTPGNSVATPCDRLVVLRAVSPKEAEIIYDGRGEAAWEKAGTMSKNGQRVISLARLRAIGASNAHSAKSGRSLRVEVSPNRLNNFIADYSAEIVILAKIALFSILHVFSRPYRVEIESIPLPRVTVFEMMAQYRRKFAGETDVIWLAVFLTGRRHLVSCDLADTMDRVNQVKADILKIPEGQRGVLNEVRQSLEPEASDVRALSSSEQQMAKALSTQPQFQNLSTADLRKILPNYGYAPRQVSAILSVARPNEVPEGGLVTAETVKQWRTKIGEAQIKASGPMKTVLGQTQQDLTQKLGKAARDNDALVEWTRYDQLHQKRMNILKALRYPRSCAVLQPMKLSDLCRSRTIWRTSRISWAR